MPDSERTFKIKVISLTSAIICIQSVSHGKEIVQYLQNYKRHKVDQGCSRNLLQSSAGVSLLRFLHDF